MRSRPLTERPRNGSYSPSYASLHSLSSEGNLFTPSATRDTIYEYSSLEAPLDPRRRYSMDAINQSDVFSRLGLGYLQSAKQQEQRTQNANKWIVGGSTPTTMPLVDHRFDSLSFGRHSRSLDSDLFLATTDAHLQAFIAQRGHSLPTTLDQNPTDFN